MWKQILYLSWLVAAGCSDIADREYPEPQPAPAATTDSQATVQTRNLLGNLRSIAENGGTLFGHQCSSLYGIGWSGDVDRSDVKSICGDYPAMMGWDLAQIELGIWIPTLRPGWTTMRKTSTAINSRTSATVFSKLMPAEA